jgi:hypothetical protein
MPGTKRLRALCVGIEKSEHISEAESARLKKCEDYTVPVGKDSHPGHQTLDHSLILTFQEVLASHNRSAKSLLELLPGNACYFSSSFRIG